MRYLADATFLTYAGLIEIQFLERHAIHGIRLCVKETQNNLRDPILARQVEEFVKLAETGKRIEKADKNLSETDNRLLSTAVEGKNDTLLITDDQTLSFEARKRSVYVLSTPAFIMLLAKKGDEERQVSLIFLNKLLKYYNREKKVLKAIREITEMRG